MSCPPFGLTNVESSSLEDNWYITGRCVSNIGRLIIYALNIVVYGTGALFGLIAICINLRANKNWFKTMLSKPVMACFFVSVGL